MDKTKAKRP